MIGLVRLALRRPYTSAIAALLILLMGALSITRMIVDIFPVIDIPVVLVVWNYNGLTTEDMERRVVFISERAYSTTVNGISRIESQSIPSIGLLRVYFQPGTDIGGAIAQITSVNNSILRIAPPGMTATRGDPVQCVERACRADDALQQDADRAADLRLQPQLHPGEAVHHPGPLHAGPVRRQVAPDQRGHRSGAAGGQRLFPDRCRQRVTGLQCHRARRYRAHWRAGIQRAVEFQSERG